jgi:acetoin utilization protein AcuB
MRDIAINRIMTVAPTTVTRDDSVAQAKKLLESEGIHHLPVVDDGVLVGILSSSDLLKLNILRERPDALAAISVHQVMEADPVTLDIFADLIDVATKLAEGGFHALPVVESDNVLVGIVTSSDLVNHLLMQVPRSDGSLRDREAAEPGSRVTDATLTSSMRGARAAIRDGHDDPMAAALLHLVEQNRLLKEVSLAAELYLRSGNAEHEHSVLVIALANLQRSGDS